MKKQGLDKPHIDDYTTRQAFDISDIQIADTSRDDEPDGAKVFSERDFRCRFAEFADIVFEEILRRKNVALTVECMRFIFGKSRYRSESEIANSLKMTRANVSARCVELRDKFGMEASLFGTACVQGNATGIPSSTPFRIPRKGSSGYPKASNS